MVAPAKIKLYSSEASQWASVPLLTLAAKQYKSDEYELVEVDLFGGENFNPEYVKINPNATIPSLTASNLSKPLIESTDILAYLDQSHSATPSLFPKDPKAREKVNELIQHVHQDKLSTNLILLQARNEQEMNEKKNSMWKDFLRNRQEKLGKYGAAHPEISVYSDRIKDNHATYQLYTASENGSAAHEAFFESSDKGYKDFAAGLAELDSLLVLPYAAGEDLTAADLHIVPWLAHALWGAGGKAIFDFEPLEARIRTSVPEFTFGTTTKTWWKNISETDAFKTVFPALH